MSAPNHPNEQEHNAIAQGIGAANELRELTPELHAIVLTQVERIEDYMAANGGILDPDLAVQAWFQVFAESKIAKRLGKLMKFGSQAAARHDKRVRQDAATRGAS